MGLVLDAAHEVVSFFETLEFGGYETEHDDLLSGTKRSGAKSPARSPSYSSRKTSTGTPLKTFAATGS